MFYKRPEPQLEERVVRVIATTIEGLVRSRPRMDPEFLIFGVNTYRPASTSVSVAYDPNAETFRILLRCSGLPNIYLSLSSGSEDWAIAEPASKFEPVMGPQRTAEMVAAGAFTRGQIIAHVSDASIEYAKQKIKRAICGS